MLLVCGYYAKVFLVICMPKSPKNAKVRAPRNRTIEVADGEIKALRKQLVFANESKDLRAVRNKIICRDAFKVLGCLPKAGFDLLFADPPYNLTKAFGNETFRTRTSDEYEAWLDSWAKLCVPLLKPSSSVYICGDWRSSSAIQRVGSKYFKLQNRITWEREKGRGAKQNWKNTAEDIWFFTVSDKFTFNLDAVKLRRKVLAPYKENGRPKDWRAEEGGNFR